MIINTLRTIFKRDLNKLIEELEAYQDESMMWETRTNINNSAGNLALHLVGNLNAFVGGALGNSGYIRQRELEFSRKFVARKELVKMIKDTASEVDRTLKEMPESRLTENFPVKVFKELTSTEYMLIHLTTHLSYHLGQINYHRRLIDS